MQTIVIVGAGGIGSNLFQKITRYAPSRYNILLIDGDIVEEKNILRQMFTMADVGRNKAEVLTTKANNTLTQRNSFYDDYLPTKKGYGVKKIQQLTSGADEIILFGCVDNHPIRRELELFFEQCDCECLYIDSANGESSGDVVSVYKHKVGAVRGAVRSMYDASVLFDNENDPTNSCGVQLDAGNIQTLIANDKAAIIALEVFHEYLKALNAEDFKNFTGLWRFGYERV